MCGILGLVNINGSEDIDRAKFNASLHTMVHRGPDAEIVEQLDKNTIFGHLRLSIIDVDSRNNQPFTLLNRYTIVYNGEIFNYIELRSELASLGATFVTNGDTEVLLYAFIYWGEECVMRLNGMWAFAIYDKLERRIFCSRDRFGQKPFNYAICNGYFIFASEIKAILRYFSHLASPNYSMIASFCRSSVGAQHEESWFESIVRLQPGSNLTLDSGKLRINRYWQYPTQGNCSLDALQTVEKYKYLFDDSVRLRMRSDVPLGLTLSGGLDSVSIAYMMQSNDSSPHHCFTAAFDRDAYSKADISIYTDKSLSFDESNVAREIAEALNLNFHAIQSNCDDFVSSLRKVIFHLESGNSSPAVLPVAQIFKYASKYVKVVLEGQGADELLGGYIISVIWPHIIGLIKRGKFNQARFELNGYLAGNTLSYSLKMALRNLSNSIPALVSVYHKINGIDAIFGDRLLKQIQYKDYPNLTGEGLDDPLSNVLLRQHSGGLVNLLHYGDALSMAFGVENRMPFLDHRLVEYAWMLDPAYKVKNGYGKHIQRSAMQGIVPSNILNCRSKIGFLTPISSQFCNTSSSESNAYEILTSNRFIQRGLFSKDGIHTILKIHRSGEKDFGNILFRILSVELWFREFIDNHR